MVAAFTFGLPIVLVLWVTLTPSGKRWYAKDDGRRTYGRGNSETDVDG